MDALQRKFDAVLAGGKLNDPEQPRGKYTDEMTDLKWKQRHIDVFAHVPKAKANSKPTELSRQELQWLTSGGVFSMPKDR
jgi:hypothetical protein